MESGETGLRCSHCGRRVHETMHTRDAWRVDYYRLHGGKGELTTVTDAAGGSLSYIKLMRTIEDLTCADCYRDPAVQRAREEIFRPEDVEEAAAGE